MKAIDPDNPPLTDAQLAELRPARDVLPPELFARLTKRRPGQRGPGAKGPAMEVVSLRLPSTVVTAFKSANAKGWRTDVRTVLEREADKMGQTARRG